MKKEGAARCYVKEKAVNHETASGKIRRRLNSYLFVASRTLIRVKCGHYLEDPRQLIRKGTIETITLRNFNGSEKRISQEWANKLAKDRRLSHRPNNNYGENVFYSSNSPSDATQCWYNELKTIGKKMDAEEAFRIYSIGHFTQVVWKESKKMGISFATDRGHFYVVANYFPSGNFMNSVKQNVSLSMNIFISN